MSSLGWYLGRAALWASLAVVAMVRHSDVSYCIYDDSKHDVPSSLHESAFDDDLYHQLKYPFNSYPCLPRNVHISQASNVDEDLRVNMTISFSLDYASKQCRGAYILYGRQGLLLDRYRVEAVHPVHYNFTSSITGEYYESDWIHHVTIPHLQAGGIEYWYQIVALSMSTSDAAQARTRGLLRGGMTQETPIITFRTPPHNDQPTAIALIGDLGQTVNSTKTMAHIHRATMNVFNPHPVSLLFIVGDMSYADSDPHRWPSWFELMEPLLRSTPLQVAAGNHEIECDNITKDIFVPYEHWFSNANRLGSAETRPVHSQYQTTLWNHSCSTPSQFLGHYNYGNAFSTFQHGLAQIVILSSYSDTRPGSIQYQWLEQVLQSVDRSKTPWILVGFHCPFYTTFEGHVNETQAMQMKESMEPLFVQYGVNLVLSGHDHAYSRSHPLALDHVVESGPTYITIGAGGNREMERARKYRQEHPESWVATRDRFEYGYGNLLVTNATHAHWSWVRDGTTTEGVQDHVWLLNPYVV